MRPCAPKPSAPMRRARCTARTIYPGLERSVVELAGSAILDIMEARVASLQFDPAKRLVVGCSSQRLGEFELVIAEIVDLRGDSLMMLNCLEEVQTIGADDPGVS